MKMEQGYANSDSRHHVAAQIRGNSLGDTAPLSPVQAQLLRQRELLSELDGTANSLIDPLRTALSHDPRESKDPNDAAAVATQGPGCDLEEALMKANSQILAVVERLHQIRNCIRL